MARGAAPQRVQPLFATLTLFAGLIERLADLALTLLQAVECAPFGLLRGLALSLLQGLAGLAHGPQGLAQRRGGLTGLGSLLDKLLQLFLQVTLGLLIGFGPLLAAALLAAFEGAVEQRALLLAQLLQLLQALFHLLARARQSAAGGKLAQQAAQRLQALFGGAAGAGMGQIAHLVQHRL